MNIIPSPSDASRTNQIRITSTPNEIAEKLFQYLYKRGKGIEAFVANDLIFNLENNTSLSFYQKRHRAIKQEIRKRLLERGVDMKISDINCFLSYMDKKSYVFFLTPSKEPNSNWKQLFLDKSGGNNRERIINLIFKTYILGNNSDTLDSSVNGLEEIHRILLVHEKSLTKSDDLEVWGNSIYVKYNHHNILTLTLSQKRLLFLSENHYTVDGDDLGEILVYNDKRYYCFKKLDGRQKKRMNFMQFDTEDENFEKFKKTQLYLYINLTTKLESFLKECEISYEAIDFQASHYIKNPFLKAINKLEQVEIINNSGSDLTTLDVEFLENLLLHEGISEVSFYENGKTISTYESLDGETCWRIKEIIPWESIQLNKDKNYLIFNKVIDEEIGSMARQDSDGLWYPTDEIGVKEKGDFYSQLKRRFGFLESKSFFSMQGKDIDVFNAVGTGSNESTWSILNYSVKKANTTELHQETQLFTSGQDLEPHEAICHYIAKQHDKDELEKFYKKYDIKISSEFKKILIEIGIKNWIRKSLLDSSIGIAVNAISVNKKHFCAVYTRSPRKQDSKAIAVEFLYENGFIFIQNVITNVEEIKKRFPFLKKDDKGKLFDDQQIFADEEEKVYFKYLSNDKFTPTLIGRKDIMEKLENGTLQINRKAKSADSTRLLPLVLYYSDAMERVKDIHDMICLELSGKGFIRYYVPLALGLGRQSKNRTGFLVYDLIGKTYVEEDLQEGSLIIQHPIPQLHFGTLTQNILKISENSQSSILQKVARVFIEN
jgi:hypothetical protein